MRWPSGLGLFEDKPRAWIGKFAFEASIRETGGEKVPPGSHISHHHFRLDSYCLDDFLLLLLFMPFGPFKILDRVIRFPTVGV